MEYEEKENLSELDSQFDKLFINSDPILKDSYLLEKKYIPNNIPARNDELRFLSTQVSPIIKDNEMINTFVYGNSGVGKTICIKHIVKILNHGVGDNKLVDLIEINCKIRTTQVSCYKAILEHYDIKYSQKEPIEYYVKLVLSTINEKAKQYKHYSLILFLDEITSLSDTKILNFEGQTTVNNYDLLYVFSRIIVQKFISAKNCSVGILIACNQSEFLSSIDVNILSSAGFSFYLFDNYKKDQILQILWNRKECFQEGVMSYELYEEFSEYIADNHFGDIRKALDIIKKAGYTCSYDGKSKITWEDLMFAETGVTTDDNKDIILNKSKLEKAVLISIDICTYFIETPHSGMIFDVTNLLLQFLGSGIRTVEHLSRTLSILQTQQLILPTTLKGYHGNTRGFVLTQNTTENIHIIYTDEIISFFNKEFYSIKKVINNKLPKKNKMNAKNERLIALLDKKLEPQESIEKYESNIELFKDIT